MAMIRFKLVEWLSCDEIYHGRNAEYSRTMVFGYSYLCPSRGVGGEIMFTVPGNTGTRLGYDDGAPLSAVGPISVPSRTVLFASHCA